MGYHPNWQEYNSAYHLLTTSLIKERTAPYIRPNEFDWDGLMDDLVPCMSSGEQILVCAAFDLWGASREDYTPVNLREIAYRLDDRYMHRVLDAVRIAAGDTSPIREVPTTAR